MQMEPTDTKNMGRVLQFEANRLARRMDREHRKLKEAAERELFAHQVIETNDDDLRGDLISLILNAKPANLTEFEWFKELEGRNGCKAATYSRWRAMEVKRPTSHSERATLQALGLGVFYGRRR